MNSAIVSRFYDGEVFYVDYAAGQKWLPVRETQNGPRIGYMHSSRIRLL